MKLEKITPLSLVFLSLSASSVAVSSSFTECYLEVEVLEIEKIASSNSIESIDVKVITVDETISYGCGYQAGQRISIENIAHEKIVVADINSGTSLDLNFLDYQANGPDGPVSGTTWTILKIK